jgi:hypothetical protein
VRSCSEQRDRLVVAFFKIFWMAVYSQKPTLKRLKLLSSWQWKKFICANE